MRSADGTIAGWRVRPPANMLLMPRLLLLQVRAPKVEEISTMEASLRLDAVGSAGFRMSRSKMMDAIKSGERPCLGESQHSCSGLRAIWC